MPVEWQRKSWAPGSQGWPTFDADGKVIRDAEEAGEGTDEPNEGGS